MKPKLRICFDSGAVEVYYLEQTDDEGLLLSINEGEFYDAPYYSDIVALDVLDAGGNEFWQDIARRLHRAYPRLDADVLATYRKRGQHMEEALEL